MDELFDKTLAALKKHGFKVEAVKDKTEARDKALALIPAGASVGVPGSASVRATGLVEALKARGQVVFDHWDATLPPAGQMKARKSQLTAGVLVTSVNALAATGELVNMDGIGNRVAASLFGPGKVIFIVGKNKLAPDLDSARERVRKIAAPRRAKELGLKLPCVEKGECTDCNSPGRICRAEVIIHRPPSFTQTIVILVDEELGN